MSHNGWTNYATWRVNLELFDGMSVQDFTEDDISAVELAAYLEDFAESFIDEHCDHDILKGWLVSFLHDVDFVEIARHLIDAAE